MRKSRFLGAVALTVLVILFCSFGTSLSLGELSLDFFRVVFRSEAAKEVFDLETAEAEAVFGDEGEAVFL